MRFVVSFAVYAEHLPGGANKLLATTKCGSDVAEVERVDFDENRYSETIEFLFEASDPRIDEVLAIVRAHNQDPFVAHYYEFTEEERQAAPLLVMSQDANENVWGGPLYGTKFDRTNACPSCGTGTRQLSPMYVPQDELQMVRKHRAIGGYNGTILLDGGMVKKLRDNNITGIAGFGEVYARMKKGGRSLVAREQIFMNHTLPPEAPSAQLDRSTACKLCGRAEMKAVGGPPWRTVYRRQDLSDIRDFNQSWEWYGGFELNSDPEKNRYPRPVTLVTPKVMNIFREAGVTTFEWTPIFVED